MSTATIELHSPLAEAENPKSGILASFKGIIDAIQEANARRRMRHEMALLDDLILRDLGFGTDEIHRVRAGEDFTPRTWIG